MRSLVFAGLIFIYSLIPSQSQAEDCSDALIVETYSQNSAMNMDWRLSQFVSEEEWNSIQKKADASAIIYGVPMGGSYGEYKAASKKKISEMGESLTSQQVDNILWTGLGGNSLLAYQSCLQSKSYGLFLYPRKATKTALEMVLEYRPIGAGGGDITLNWASTSPQVDNLLAKISPHTEWTFFVDRPSGSEDILLAVNGGGLTAPAVVITAYPPPLPVWNSEWVTMRDPAQNTGQPGSASLPDGYEIRNIRYGWVGPSPHDHEFKFDLFDGSVLLKPDVSYVGNNATPWEDRIKVLSISGHKLRFAFSGWNDNKSDFHFIWQ